VFYRLADQRIVRLLDDVDACVRGGLKAKANLAA